MPALQVNISKILEAIWTEFLLKKKTNLTWMFIEKKFDLNVYWKTNLAWMFIEKKFELNVYWKKKTNLTWMFIERKKQIWTECLLKNKFELNVYQKSNFNRIFIENQIGSECL